MSAVLNEFSSAEERRAFVHISDLTGAKIRIFLAELAEGVSNYRSLHSLTEQVEHQYHGRFLIELIQNAHDAFDNVPSDEKPNRIEIIFDPTDSPHGSLLVANDGKPFSASNFERLSQLGQSDKDPQKSIGNKGIGFRSVLEISERPEVYSRDSPHSPSFDGYCFAFRPEVVQALIEPMVELAVGGTIPPSPVSQAPLVDWSQEMLAKFRKRAHTSGLEWLIGETKYLSPYLLPVPLTDKDSVSVFNLEDRGFASVVRLPLKSHKLQVYVLEHMKRLTSSTVLFLDKVSTLTLRVVDGDERSYTRASADDTETVGLRVSINDSMGDYLEYAVWSKNLHVPSGPEKFRAAVSALPGRWPEITDISVSVAVKLGDIAEAGRFSIYLPTFVATGSAVHVNAPFFGDMSRTSIPFDDAYNQQLLQTAGDLALKAVREHLAGKGALEAKAIIDLLAPFGNDDVATARWLSLISEAALRTSASIDEEPLILAEQGWRPLNATSLIPTCSKATLLTEQVIRRHATFDIFHPCLSSRNEQLKALALSRYPETGAFPLTSDIASTVAAIATEMLSQGGNWNLFWLDVMVLLPNGQKELSLHEVLLGADGCLHSLEASRKVFFVPRQGTQDDGDVGGESAATQIPSSLQRSVAFLNDQIQLYETSKPTLQTSVRAYLGNGLVSQFRVEAIFSGVLYDVTPKLPVPIEGQHFDICRDIMEWAIRLLGNIVARGRGAEATFRLLRQIPVPCEGGWYPMGETSFGVGWSNTSGATLASYLSALKSPAGSDAKKRVLLPPGHPAWGNVNVAEQALLAAGGVFDGLRLIERRPDTWSSQFQASNSNFSLPSSLPPDFTKEQWSAYRAIVSTETRPPFTSSQTYVVGTLYTFPGFNETETLPDEQRLELSELILQSLPKWSQGLVPLEITKQGGQANRLLVSSPINLFLQFKAWMGIRDGKKTTFSLPSERWHVPADVIGSRTRHFAHLKALPSTFASRLDMNSELAKILGNFGLPRFNLLVETSSPKLLEALTSAVGSENAPESNVLFGQLRDAWHCFRPVQNQAPLAKLVVRRSDKQLVVILPTEEAPVYLPDSGVYVTELEQFDIPVLGLYPNDAKELKEWFDAAYGARVQLTSKLKLIPYVQGTAWTGVSGRALVDSEIGWMIRPLLTMVAFHGHFRGIHSAAFQERVNVLREARVDWVPSASVVVMRDESKVITTEVPAFWDVRRKTIVASELCRRQPGHLSTVFSQALERDDLELPIRYVLSGLASADAEPENMALFLGPLRISFEQIQQVVEHLQGDVGHIGRLVNLLVTVLAPDKDASVFLDARDEDELRAILMTFDISHLDVPLTLQSARESQDLFEFGRVISYNLGEIAELSNWNRTLHRLDQARLINRSWKTQLQAGLEEASGLIKHLLASLIREKKSTSYLECLANYDRLPLSIDLSETLWEVSFQATMNIVADVVKSWNCSENVVTEIRESKSVDNLRERFLSLGILMDIDPDECARKNHQLVETVVLGIEKLRLAWWLKTEATGTYGEWQSDADGYRLVAAERLTVDAFTRIWSEAEVFSLLRTQGQHAHLTTFWLGMLSSVDLIALQSALTISSEELAEAESKLASQRAERKQRRNLVSVCGEDFDSSDDNLDQLWNFLVERISDDSLSAYRKLDLGKPTELVALVSPTGHRRHDAPRKPTNKQNRQSKSADELVGLAGEIFVYRMLQQNYGSDIVTPSAWVSENSKRVFPYNQADDGKGCDFAFAVSGKLLKIEVKSSVGDDESFKLGSSEIRLAMDLATRGKRRREVFILVQVKHALSITPTAVVLPNPYDPKFAGMFIIEEADARVRYRTQSK